MRYPYSRPDIQDSDITEVLETLKSQFLTQGPIVQKLETKLCNLFGAKYAVVCNSGTAALHMAYAGLGLNEKMGLVTTPISFLATANAAAMCNAPIEFADVDPQTGNITPQTIKDAVEKANFEVGAISVVHLGGRACDLVEIREYAQSKNIKIIEDACHAPLAKYSDKLENMYSVGNCEHSDAATLSFHAIKHITTGEGGVLMTNSDFLADYARKFRSHNIIKNRNEFVHKEHAHQPWYYEMHDLGFNYRLSDINCSLALGQIERLRKNLAKRKELALAYTRELAGEKNIELPAVPNTVETSHAWHLYSLRIDFTASKVTRIEFMKRLDELGVGTQVHYIPIYRQPFYAQKYNPEDFPGAEEYYRKTISIPMYLSLEKNDIKVICDKIKTVLS